MGVIGRSGNRGFVFIDLLFALFILLVGFSGIFAVAISLQRAATRYGDTVREYIKVENRIGTEWFAYESE